MEGDWKRFRNQIRLLYFNPLPPHGGRRPLHSTHGTRLGFQSTPSAWRETHTYLNLTENKIFQSTPSAWRETVTFPSPTWEESFQSTPSAWRETRACTSLYLYIGVFQSTPSAWRETQIMHLQYCFLKYFNPLPPHGGRLVLDALATGLCVISIHSLRMEGDISSVIKSCGAKYFNPLPPHGGRLEFPPLVFEDTSFQSTPSAWRETCYPYRIQPTSFHFNPLPPHGGRHSAIVQCALFQHISIHSLRMEGD